MSGAEGWNSWIGHVMPQRARSCQQLATGAFVRFGSCKFSDSQVTCYPKRLIKERGPSLALLVCWDILLVGARAGRYRETMGVGVVASVRCLDNLRYLEGQGEWGNTPNCLLEALAILMMNLLLQPP